MSDFAMISGNDQWLRVAHHNTNLLTDSGVVQLAWKASATEEMTADQQTTPLPTLQRLAFDPACRVYRSVIAKNNNGNNISTLAWSNRSQVKQAQDLFADAMADVGDFSHLETKPVIGQAGSLTIDTDGIMAIADVVNNKVLLFDLLSEKVRRTVTLNGKPVAMCESGGQFYVVVASSGTNSKDYAITTFTLTSHTEGVGLPSSLQSSPNDEWLTQNSIGAITLDAQQRVFLLAERGTEHATVHTPYRHIDPIAVPYASDILFDDDGVLVVARSPGASFLRFSLTDNQVAQLPSMQASYYDGLGISIDPKGNIAYWAVKKDVDLGVLNASITAMAFQSKGRICCYRLDNGHINQAWGKVYLDACVPQGTAIKLGFITSDEPDTYPAVAASPPQNITEFSVVRPDLTPPLPSQLATDKLQVNQAVHKRSQERELPWSFAEEPWRTFEAPVNAPAGRYLWLVIELQGTSHYSPKIKHVRVEYASTLLLSKLPAMYAEQGSSSEFLQRYLSMLESNFMELGERAKNRNVLLDPHAAPAAVLPWLASMLGLPIDDRWSVAAKRDILQQAMWLFKYKGTVAGLKRLIDIYLQDTVTVQIVEHYQTRGLGGAFVGENDGLEANSVLGAGFRIGGRIGASEALILNPDDTDPASADESNGIVDAITDNAHRFSVIVPLQLTAEQADVIDLILEVYRPAHTLVQVCSVDSGMRAGLGLHLGLTSVVGKASGFGSLRVGDSTVGGKDVIGRPQIGMTVGSAKAGVDARVG